MEWTRKNLGVSNISLLPNFVASEDKPSSKPPREHTLLFVGKLTEQKGVDVLIKALAGVLPVSPDINLRIVGDGPEAQKLKDLVAALNLADRVVFVGKLANAQVMKEYDDALLVIIPSKYVESFGIVGIEAMSRGKVIIASKIGGLPDLVDNNDTGFFVQPGDIDDLSSKIIYAIRNRSLLPEMGARARAKYERCFSKQTYTSALLSVYHGVIQDRL
jgi:1,4-alpha-glucan branching enzyme